MKEREDMKTKERRKKTNARADQQEEINYTIKQANSEKRCREQALQLFIGKWKS